MQDTRIANVSWTGLHVTEQRLCLCCAVSLKPTVCRYRRPSMSISYPNGNYVAFGSFSFTKMDYEVSPISKEKLLHWSSIHPLTIHPPIYPSIYSTRQPNSHYLPIDTSSSIQLTSHHLSIISPLSTHPSTYPSSINPSTHPSISLTEKFFTILPAPWDYIWLMSVRRVITIIKAKHHDVCIV